MANNYWKNQKREEKRRALESQRSAEEQALFERIQSVWQVPDHAAEEFVALEDAVGEHGARAIANLIQAMLSNPESNDE